ncbi:MAG: hypothetical protein VB118_11660 [Oscillospiraceae bacterium]|nr:hypothetical protein [Oscillospiraceae bacterium]
MKTIRKTLMAILIMAILAATILFLTACNRNPEKITADQATERVQAYFKSSHNLNVTVKSVSYEQVGEHEYLNIVTVSYGEAEYKLILNKNNEPISDNVSALETIKSIDISSIDNKIRQLGFKRDGYYDLRTDVSYQNFRYSVCFSVISEDCPSKDSKDVIYSLLGQLKNEGIEEFFINISSPNFLIPKIECGYGEHGIWLTGIGIDTDVDSASFEKQYYKFVDQIYWDEQKYDEIILQLTQLGYENACFFIYRWYSGNTLEIVLYCESDNSLSDEPAITLLEEMDDSYFKVGDSEIKYTLRHIYK